MRHPLTVAALAVGVLALAVGGTAGAAPARAHATTVHVTAKDFSFALSRTSVKRGPVTFVIRNAGHTDHDFSIAGKTSKTIAPGVKTTLKVTFGKAGRFRYSCTVDGHADLGMHGVLHVTASG